MQEGGAVEGNGEPGPISAGEFGAAFKGFLEQAAAQAPLEDPYFVGRLKELFGREPYGFPVVSHDFQLRDHPNLQRSLDAYLERDGRSAELVGVTTGAKRYNGIALSELVARPRRAGLMGDGSPTPGPIEYVDITLGESETVTCIRSGVMLITDGERRLAALVSTSDSGIGRNQIRVEAMAPERGDAEAFLAEVRRGIRERNVYRGRVISLVQEVSHQPIEVRIHSLPPIERSDIILPSGVLERVERQTIEFSRHVERLREAGQHAKRGLLLHGPPGTGKTLTAKYIAGQMADRTVLLMTGPAVRLIEPACTMARLLQPSMLIVEDVDLIAEERTREHASTRLLFELLNQLDGMEEDADVVFLLTTNRPDLLEPALAARPGRVDLAVEIPLPDDSCRRRLLELYSRGLQLDVDDLERFVVRTRGVSAAFVRELVRKAALAAADREGPLVATSQDLEDALQELLFESGELTRSLLGGHVTS
jgi:hypothetical protein